MLLIRDVKVGEDIFSDKVGLTIPLDVSSWVLCKLDENSVVCDCWEVMVDGGTGEDVSVANDWLGVIIICDWLGVAKVGVA